MKNIRSYIIWLAVTIILAVAISAYTIPLLIPSSSTSVYLQSEKIVEGEKIVLNYHIINNKNTPMSNVKITNMISGFLGSINQTEIGNVSERDEYEGVYSINSSDMRNFVFPNIILPREKIDIKGKRDLTTIISYEYEGAQIKVTLTTTFEVV